MITLQSVSVRDTTEQDQIWCRVRLGLCSHIAREGITVHVDLLFLLFVDVDGVGNLQTTASCIAVYSRPPTDPCLDLPPPTSVLLRLTPRNWRRHYLNHKHVETNCLPGLSVRHPHSPDTDKSIISTVTSCSPGLGRRYNQGPMMPRSAPALM